MAKHFAISHGSRLGLCLATHEGQAAVLAFDALARLWTARGEAQASTSASHSTPFGTPSGRY